MAFLEEMLGIVAVMVAYGVGEIVLFYRFRLFAVTSGEPGAALAGLSGQLRARGYTVAPFTFPPSSSRRWLAPPLLVRRGRLGPYLLYLRGRPDSTEVVARIQGGSPADNIRIFLPGNLLLTAFLIVKLFLPVGVASLSFFALEGVRVGWAIRRRSIFAREVDLARTSAPSPHASDPVRSGLLEAMSEAYRLASEAHRDLKGLRFMYAYLVVAAVPWLFMVLPMLGLLYLRGGGVTEIYEMYRLFWSLFATGLATVVLVVTVLWLRVRGTLAMDRRWVESLRGAVDRLTGSAAGGPRKETGPVVSAPSPGHLGVDGIGDLVSAASSFELLLDASQHVPRWLSQAKKSRRSTIRAVVGLMVGMVLAHGFQAVVILLTLPETASLQLVVLLSGLLVFAFVAIVLRMWGRAEKDKEIREKAEWEGRWIDLRSRMTLFLQEL